MGPPWRDRLGKGGRAAAGTVQGRAGRSQPWRESRGSGRGTGRRAGAPQPPAARASALSRAPGRWGAPAASRQRARGRGEPPSWPLTAPRPVACGAAEEPVWRPSSEAGQKRGASAAAPAPPAPGEVRPAGPCCPPAAAAAERRRQRAQPRRRAQGAACTV